ncbi:MAG: 6-phosphogluconolactonase [Desulfobulbaceae bacterium]|uniref:6-phosphogluconolactonase n=1 Tax=Candidatus Desulfobia pelagia TaxID=2841692 RepID=A0A8J6TD47_9BACT|nr:6-phosphogluconolactonase [Candidatus Desulfobia pelagia]
MNDNVKKYSRPCFLEFENSEELVSKLASRVSQLLAEGIAKRGRASLAVSGGSTPVPLFQALSCIDLQWERVVITLVDERWVDVAEEQSNEHLVRTYLLRNKAAQAVFVGMKTSDVSARAAEKECSERLQSVPRPFDVLVLGMGNDGHTASLFPGSVNLADAVDRDAGKTCICIVPSPAPHERMTLTLPTLLDSLQIVVHITGNKKREVYAQAEHAGPSEEMPIRFILRQEEVPVDVYWCP